jgi:transcriptional regulator with XRE-family HTH domain
MSNFKERLNDLMVEAQIKSDQLGKAIGVSGQTIRAWCDDSQSILLSNIIKLADYFHCSIDYLVGISDSTAEYAAKQYPPFYDRLRKVMEEKGKTRYRMTKESKIKDSYFTTWKSGSDPHILSVIEVAKYLDVTIDYLIGREK